MNGSELKIAHGETVASQVGGCGLSRAQSGERAQDAVQGRQGLCQVCTGAGEACERVSMRLLKNKPDSSVAKASSE